MKSLSCKDMGEDCPYVCRAETVEEVLETAKAHAIAEHGKTEEDYKDENYQALRASRVREE